MLQNRCFRRLYKSTKKQAENQLKSRFLRLFAPIVHKPLFFVEIALPHPFILCYLKLNVTSRTTF